MILIVINNYILFIKLYYTNEKILFYIKSNNHLKKDSNKYIQINIKKKNKNYKLLITIYNKKLKN